MKAFRKVLFWCHLAAGLTAGAIVLIMSVTGVLLTYEKQLALWADTRATGFSRPAGNAAPLAPAALLATVTAAGVSPASLTLRGDGSVPASVTVSGGREGERTLFVDPYTGAVLGEGAVGTHRFFRAVTDWHRWLGRAGEGRAAGRAITGAANLLFLFIVVSGLYLWFPRSLTRQQFRQVLWFKRGISGRARDFNWHHVIGFWCLVPLFIVVLSGVVISYPWASDLVFRAAGEVPSGPPQRRPGGPSDGPGRPTGGGSTGVVPAAWTDLDGLVQRAQAHRADWKTISLRLPREAGAPVAFTVDAGTGGEPQKRETLTLDRAGNTVKVERFSDSTRGRQWRAILRFAHTGEVLGWAGQTMAGLASFGACFLVYTGGALSWRRWRAWRVRRAK
jgi:uncharacterized iron-regulated membrane protein